MVSNHIILNVQNLSARYHKRVIINNINLKVRKGDIVAVFGANGSGKSTLLKAIVNLIDIVEGSVFFKNANITESSTSQIINSGISFLLQDRNVFTNLTVKENIEIVRKFDVESDGYYEELLGIFPMLNKLSDKRVGLLSGGERRMLAIVMILINRPELVLMDEPSVGLSPNIVQNIMEYIKEISCKFGITFLIIEQNIKAALKIANRIYILSNGNIIAEHINSDETNLEENVRMLFYS